MSGKNGFTPEGLEEVITRRIANTGETRDEARSAILKLTERLNRGEMVLDVRNFETGEHLGYRDENGFRPAS
jgi:hypothetical protein